MTKVLRLAVATIALLIVLLPLVGEVGQAKARNSTMIGTWNLTGSMNDARQGHTATLLTNGKVLVAGGNSGNIILASAELYDPGTGMWSSTGSMNIRRRYFTATLLANGKVLVAGGETQPNPPFTTTAELYDPSTGMWSFTGNMNMARNSHTATLLTNGKVLVTGGLEAFGPLTASAELYDPNTGMWSFTGSMSAARQGHTATLLATGMVLVTGGKGLSGLPLSSAELYDPAAGTWSLTGSMLHVREFHSATLLANGMVLVAGGKGIQHGKPIANRFAELYNPTTRTWASAGLMNSAHYFHTATRVGSKVLVAGGFLAVEDSPPVGFSRITPPTAIAELYDPVTNSWSLTGSMNDARAHYTATQLSSGKILVTGSGYREGNTFHTLASAEIFQ
jgi:hypothetical protein